VSRHYELHGRETGYLYEQEHEDPGSISVGVPDPRQGFLSTHLEMVRKAQKEGKYVHPLIAWAARRHPAHTGEEILTSSRRAQQAWGKDRYFQPMLSHPHPSDPGLRRQVLTQIGRQFSEGLTGVHRRTYKTESGETKVALAKIGEKDPEGLEWKPF
jgi:hypothetical protein